MLTEGRLRLRSALFAVLRLLVDSSSKALYLAAFGSSSVLWPWSSCSPRGGASVTVNKRVSYSNHISQQKMCICSNETRILVRQQNSEISVKTILFSFQTSIYLLKNTQLNTLNALRWRFTFTVKHAVDNIWTGEIWGAITGWFHGRMHIRCRCVNNVLITWRDTCACHRTSSTDCICHRRLVTWHTAAQVAFVQAQKFFRIVVSLVAAQAVAAQ